MDKIAVSELRANLVSILKKIEQGSTLDITSRGKVIAKLVPPDYNKKKAKDLLNDLSKNAYIGDIISPVDSQWKVLQ